MKTDQQLQSDVLAELAWEPAVDARRIDVAVADRVVTLKGRVDTYLQRNAAERAVRRIPDVRGVAVELEVELAPAHQRSDKEIAEAALHALDWHSLVPEDSVQVQVQDGWVTLEGEVDWGYQSASAEQCVNPLVGVRGLTNRIRLKQRTDPEQLRREIADAFARHARREANHITIEVDGGVVTLSGTVHSLPEHEAAIGVASAAKGVTRVIDRLHVA